MSSHQLKLMPVLLFLLHSVHVNQKHYEDIKGSQNCLCNCPVKSLCRVCLFVCSTNTHATFFSPSQAVSPDGEAIVTGAGDETLRFWNVFSKTRCTKVE